ncbi:MAG: TonB family protein [Vicinamibacterales bacterium]
MVEWMLLVLLTAGAQGSPAATKVRPSPCAAGASTSVAADSATAEFCTGEDDVRAAAALPAADRNRTQHLESAAARFRRAANATTSADLKVLALERLADAYDRKQLDRPDALEEVLRELIALTPDDLTPMYRLARAQEDRDLIDLAETTLLDARHRQPDIEEPNRMLAQFYVRRVTALHAKNLPPSSPDTASNPGEPDANGVYRIGAALTPPPREGVPQYPADARAAGIRGAVVTELVIDPSGNVVDATVVQSVPMLDDAALAAVRAWKFAPTVINGQPVPVRMRTTVNFAP